MHFKKLELVGFKSFYNKTVLHFEPGITAVVGPNGCGKSNIFDAIRWVLGEQSAKELRGSDMQDVIFNGTDSKEPLGMSEVTLTFDNSQKFFSVEHDEVNITRRIFRSGESEYLLNKAQARLKDILELLMGTGIGAESYSLIQQGKIDLVLSSRPEDRRLVFDEASGISKYKVQKREAVRKLEETEQNLLRVNDIIVEVKRQICSLERQANKARRYKEVFEELKLKEVAVATLQKKALETQKNEISGQLNSLTSEESGLTGAIQQQESRISSRQDELKGAEDLLLEIKNRILAIENSITASAQRIDFDNEKIIESRDNEKYLREQIEQAKKRISVDEEKLSNVKREYETISDSIEEKTRLLESKENQLGGINSSTKTSLEAIAKAKKDILDLAASISSVKNEISDSGAKQQVLDARKKRLEIEKAKVNEEKTQTQDNLSAIESELADLEREFQGLNQEISETKKELDLNKSALNDHKVNLEELERLRITLQSQKDFLEQLKLKYENIGESLNALVYTDRLPQDKTGGLVIKIKGQTRLNPQEKSLNQFANFKLSGEAKPIDLDTRNITQKINQIEQKIEILKGQITRKETQIAGLNMAISEKEETMRSREMNLVNKRSNRQAVLEQFNKFKEEEEMVVSELEEVEGQISVLAGKISQLNCGLSELEEKHRLTEQVIHKEQANIESNSELKEETVVTITQTSTELEALNKRIGSDKETLKILEDAYGHDKSALLSLTQQLEDSDAKCALLTTEINELESKIAQAKLEAQKQNADLKKSELQYQEASRASVEVAKNIESDRKKLDILKGRLHELQMQAKETDFKYISIKERILQAYKVNLDSQEGQSQAQEQYDENILSGDISRLKEKLDSYGTVNLVAIEEYDELKKRYDFLTKQHEDLARAKYSLDDAISKINRTTRKMFLDTFEKVRIEFRNYFRLLFNGGDAQLFLIDEQDPLESGIEIICRPPGKKLQNVLLLSGGEKSMSAIALIFAIFKVKPAPFCFLDEIDAALDEANIDRYSRLLQEFAKESQFIVITHNKKTIANADLMYGITMEESGISKIVSVRFAKDKEKQRNKDHQPQTVAVG
jgi:chromosome segregation protein